MNDTPRPWAPDDVLTPEQLAVRLQTSVEATDKLDLPTVWIGRRIRRYVWGQVIEYLRQRAEAHAA